MYLNVRKHPRSVISVLNFNTQICLRNSSNHGCSTWSTNESAVSYYVFPFGWFLRFLADCVLGRGRRNPWLIVSLHPGEHYGKDSVHPRSEYRTFTVWLFWYDLWHQHWRVHSYHQRVLSAEICSIIALMLGRPPCTGTEQFILLRITRGWTNFVAPKMKTSS